MEMVGWEMGRGGDERRWDGEVMWEGGMWRWDGKVMWEGGMGR